MWGNYQREIKTNNPDVSLTALSSSTYSSPYSSLTSRPLSASLTTMSTSRSMVGAQGLRSSSQFAEHETLGDPQCTTQSQSIGGSVDGTNGTVMLQQTEGTVYTLETTTTSASQLSILLSCTRNSPLF